MTETSALDAYSALSGSRSYYGTSMQYGGVYEWVSDWYDMNWYSNAASLSPDPTGPTTGTVRTLMGRPRALGGSTIGISARKAGYGSIVGSDYLLYSVRCARPATP